MRTIRGWEWAVFVAAAPLAVAGCGDNGGGGNTHPDAAIVADAHVVGNDTGTGTTDAGPGVDSGTGRVCSSPEGECDLIAQNCPNDDSGNPQACVYALPDETATTPQTLCAPIVSPGGSEGDSCCALNSCDVGLVCVGQTQTGSNVCSTQGTCQRYCCGSSTDCGAGQVCNPLSASFSGGVCDDVDGCDLVDQTGCESQPGTRCYPGSGTGVTQCYEPSSPGVALGEVCEYVNDCPAAAGCFTTDGSVYRCYAFCDVADGTADCGGTVSCQAVEGLPSGVGVCVS